MIRKHDIGIQFELDHNRIVIPHLELKSNNNQFACHFI